MRKVFVCTDSLCVWCVCVLDGVCVCVCVCVAYRTPVWHSDHSTMTTLQAFQEMISQRLSQVCSVQIQTNMCMYLGRVCVCVPRIKVRKCCMSAVLYV